MCVYVYQYNKCYYCLIRVYEKYVDEMFLFVFVN